MTWREQAACATGPDLWHSPERADRAIAVTICMACPVRAECHVEAQAARRDGVTLHGVWHGHDYGKGTGPLARPLRDDEAEAAIEDPGVAS